MYNIQKGWVAGIISLVVLSMPVIGFAADNGAGSIGISVTPLIREVSLNPGEAMSGTVDITNTLGAEETIYPVVMDFAASDDPNSSQPKLIQGATSDAQFALSQWVHFSVTTLVVPGKRTQSIGYTVQVPANAEPGDHYGAIFASTQPPQAGNQSSVTIGAQVGSLLLVTVSAGQTVVKGSIENFLPNQALYQSGSSVGFHSLVSNTGTIHYVPKGSVTVTDMLGKTVSVADFNKTGGNILPGSKRAYLTSTPISSYGRFTAVQNIQITGLNGQSLSLTASTVFWVIPITLILFVLLGLIILGLLFYLWERHHDRLTMQRVQVVQTPVVQAPEVQDQDIKE